MGNSKSSAGSPSVRYDKILGEIAQGVETAQTDRSRRRKSLRRLEKEGEPQPRRVAMYYARTDRALSHDDILPLTSLLKHIGKTDSLDLVVHSPGGDGTAAEKMLDLCRKYCTGRLRVVVPLYAKSAATLLALGADEIIMGETSELGPIDAQVFIVQDNQPQMVSADHFLRARDEAIKALASADAAQAQAAQIQLALLSPAFLQHCEDQLRFAKDCAGKQLRLHMFAEESKQDLALWLQRIDRIVANLTASSRHLSHGRMITAEDIKADTDLQHLRVRALPNTDPYWLALEDLLLRTDVVVRSSQVGKILFADGFELTAG